MHSDGDGSSDMDDDDDEDCSSDSSCSSDSDASSDTDEEAGGGGGGGTSFKSKVRFFGNSRVTSMKSKSKRMSKATSRTNSKHGSKYAPGATEEEDPAAAFRVWAQTDVTIATPPPLRLYKPPPFFPRARSFMDVRRLRETKEQAKSEAGQEVRVPIRRSFSMRIPNQTTSMTGTSGSKFTRTLSGRLGPSLRIRVPQAQADTSISILGPDGSSIHNPSQFNTSLFNAYGSHTTGGSHFNPNSDLSPMSLYPTSSLPQSQWLANQRMTISIPGRAESSSFVDLSPSAARRSMETKEGGGSQSNVNTTTSDSHGGILSSPKNQQQQPHTGRSQKKLVQFAQDTSNGGVDVGESKTNGPTTSTTTAPAATATTTAAQEVNQLYPSALELLGAAPGQSSHTARRNGNGGGGGGGVGVGVNSNLPRVVSRSSNSPYHGSRLISGRLLFTSRLGNKRSESPSFFTFSQTNATNTTGGGVANGSGNTTNNNNNNNPLSTNGDGNSGIDAGQDGNSMTHHHTPSNKRLALQRTSSLRRLGHMTSRGLTDGAVSGATTARRMGLRMSNNGTLTSTILSDLPSTLGSGTGANGVGVHAPPRLVLHPKVHALRQGGNTATTPATAGAGTGPTATGGGTAAAATVAGPKLGVTGGGGGKYNWARSILKVKAHLRHQQQLAQQQKLQLQQQQQALQQTAQQAAQQAVASSPDLGTPSHTHTHQTNHAHSPANGMANNGLGKLTARGGVGGGVGGGCKNGPNGNVGASAMNIIRRLQFHHSFEMEDEEEGGTAPSHDTAPVPV